MQMYDFIGMPINLGCDRNGVELVPSFLRENFKFLFDKYNIRDLGDVICKKREDILSDKLSSHSEIKFFHPILEASKDLSLRVRESIEGNRIPIICGGDHVAAFGSIAGVALSKGIENYAVIYIDAHGDFNTEKQSPSGNMHGMHISFLMGLGEEEAVQCFNTYPLLNPKNIYFIGTRALDKGEKNIANDFNMHIISSEKAENTSVKSYLDVILEDIKSKDINHIHISLDIDAIDPQFAPGTGVPEHNGMKPNTVESVLKELSKSGLCKSFDLVEFNPLLDQNTITAKLFVKYLSTFITNT